MSNNKKYFDFIFTNTNIPQILDFFAQNPKIDLTLLKDDKKNNILHLSAFQNRLNHIKIYIAHMNNYYELQIKNGSQHYKKSAKHLIAAWINQMNIQGFAPIHYASFKGNLEIIKFLENLGASLLFQTKLGLNMIHLAAQADRLNVMLYLNQIFDLNVTDFKKNTALHWAASMGSQNIVAFLLTINYIELDLFDQDQQTALHLAVKYGNTKIVKRLLIKGANRSLKNSKGQTAQDIAKINDFKNISKMVNQQFTFVDQIRFYCNLKIQYKPLSRSVKKPLIFMLTFIFMLSTSHILIIPAINIYYLYIPIGIYYIMFLILYLSLCQYPKNTFKQIDYKQLIGSLPVCIECRIPKQKRSFHCDICKICISTYDHHCPWINNCVGKNNIARFAIFLFTLIFGMLQISAYSLIGILEVQAIIRGFRFYVSQYKWQQYLYKCVFAINISITLTFIIPIILLFFVQISNLFMNQTTFQRFSRVKIKQSIQDKINQSQMDSNQNVRLLENQNQINPTNTEYSYMNCKLICYNQNDRLSNQSQSEG